MLRRHRDQGGVLMRQLIFGSIVFILVTCAWGTASIGQQLPTPRGELHIVDNNPSNWISVTFNIMEHLWELNTKGKLVVWHCWIVSIVLDSVPPGRATQKQHNMLDR
jgi:hypothetical protein